MKKQTFIKAIEALQAQSEHDVKIAKHLGKAFLNAHEANLLPDNHHISNALLQVLQEVMHDAGGSSWIEYYCYELDYGRENYRIKAYHKDGREIPLSNAGELYELLINNQKL